MKHQILAGLWITISAIGCELATEFDRSKIGCDASLQIVDGGADDGTVASFADGSVGPLPNINVKPQTDEAISATTWAALEKGRDGLPIACPAPTPDSPVLKVPCVGSFQVTNGPNGLYDHQAGDVGRCAYDIVCADDQLVAVTDGEVFVARRDVSNDCHYLLAPRRDRLDGDNNACFRGHCDDASGSACGIDDVSQCTCESKAVLVADGVCPASCNGFDYGNHVLVGQALLAHGEHGSVSVVEGQHACTGLGLMQMGHTGVTTGDHTHEAFTDERSGAFRSVTPFALEYRLTPDGEIIHGLPPVGVMLFSTNTLRAFCSNGPEDCLNGADDNDDGRVDCYDVGCYRSENCRPWIDSFSCTSYRRGDALVTCDIYGDGFLNPPDRIWIRHFSIDSREFMDAGHLRVRGHWNCDAELGLIDVAYRHWYDNDLNVLCTSPTKACLDDVTRLQDDCTGVVCTNSACGRWCDAGCPDPEPCMDVDCDDHDRCTSDSCVDGSCRHVMMPNDCAGRVCGPSPSGCHVCGGCPARANAAPNCVGGSCNYTCVGSYVNCDGNWTNGCEINTNTDLNNCGSCGNVCPNLVHTYDACIGGACGISGCLTNWGNCDGIATNGCEAHVSVDPSNCGTCRNVCPARPNADTTCSANACGFACRVGWNNCDGVAANGCEHSGECIAPDPCAGVSCDDGNACTSDSCDGGSCRHDVVGPDCGARVCGDAPNGCGGCGRCPDLPNGSEVCSSGSCLIGSCFGNYRDCDGVPGNGCEQFVGNDVGNCGSCGNVCPTPPHMVPTCVVGRCGRLCAAGFENCDGNPDNGCEHSGACPPPPPEEWCGNGVCDLGESDCPGSCPADCAPSCGDGCCTGGETCGSCASDCGECPPPPPDGPVCRNGFCEMGENCASCPDDCGACPPPPPGGCNNNGACDGGESCGTCPCDCCRQCNPGQVVTQNCDPTPGVADLCSFVQSRTCAASCSWGAWGACSGDPAGPIYEYSRTRRCGGTICAQLAGVSDSGQISGIVNKVDPLDDFESRNARLSIHRFDGGEILGWGWCDDYYGDLTIPFPADTSVARLNLLNPGDSRGLYAHFSSNCDAGMIFDSGVVRIQRCR